MSSVSERIRDIKNEINNICRRCGRNPDEVRVVAVSKTVSPEIIKESYQAGQAIFGENRVQEWLGKKDQLPPDIEWHLIGTLQRNKVKYVIGGVSLIHSVDSLALAREISKEAGKKKALVPVLLQVNISREASKHGFHKELLLESLEEIASLPGIKIRGLMTIAPLADDQEKTRPVFRALRLLAEEIAAKKVAGVDMRELSMGMSDDYVVAVEEGATLLRIGSRIFGPRNY